MRLKRSNERLAGMGVVVVELGRIWQSCKVKREGREREERQEKYKGEKEKRKKGNKKKKNIEINLKEKGATSKN